MLLIDDIFDYASKSGFFASIRLRMADIPLFLSLIEKKLKTYKPLGETIFRLRFN